MGLKQSPDDAGYGRWLLRTEVADGEETISQQALLIRSLEDASPAGRIAAIEGLLAWGRQADDTRAVVQAMECLFDDTDRSVRAHAAHATSALGGPASSSPQVYATWLVEQGKLAEATQHGQPAETALLRLAREGASDDRAKAADALSALQPSEEALLLLLELLDDPHEDVRTAACRLAAAWAGDLTENTLAQAAGSPAPESTIPESVDD